MTDGRRNSRTNSPTTVPGIPKPPAGITPGLQKYLSNLSEALEIRLGRKGDPRDRAVTLRELIDSGLAKELANAPFDPNSPGGDFTPGGEDAPDLAVPPAPLGFTADGAYSQIILGWDLPNYSNHSLTEIWRHTSDVLGDALLAGIQVGTVYIDPVGESADFYYWVRHVNDEGVVGPFNSNSGTQATTATNTQTLLDELEASIPAVAFASEIEPVGVVNSLPSTSGYTGPRLVVLTTDGKLYRLVNGSWTAAVPTADLSGQISNSQIAVNAIQGAVIAANAITSTKISNDAITTPKLAAGAVTAGEIAAGAVTATKIQSNSITASQIAANAINASELNANAVTANAIAAGAITAGAIAAGAVNATNIISNGIIVGDKLAANTITSAKIQAGTIAADRLATGSVTADKVSTNTIITSGANIQNAVITAVKIADANITSAKIQNAAVETLKIAGNAVTVPEGDSASISVDCGNSYAFLDSQLNTLATWDSNSVPTGIIIGAMAQYVGTNTSNQSSGNATAYVKMTIEWRNSSGGYTLNTADGGKTIGVTSVRKTFGGAAVSTAYLTPPSWSRGLRVRIQGRNEHFSDGATTRKASKYGYFVLAAKR